MILDLSLPYGIDAKRHDPSSAAKKRDERGQPPSSPHRR